MAPHIHVEALFSETKQLNSQLHEPLLIPVRMLLCLQVSVTNGNQWFLTGSPNALMDLIKPWRCFTLTPTDSGGGCCSPHPNRTYWIQPCLLPCFCSVHIWAGLESAPLVKREPARAASAVKPPVPCRPEHLTTQQRKITQSNSLLSQMVFISPQEKLEAYGCL